MEVDKMRKPFEGLLGNTVELRLLEYLLPLDGIKFNISELTEEAGISRTMVDKVVKKFADLDIMKVTSTKAGVAYYEINPESPFFKLFDEINNRLIEHMLEPETVHFLKEIIGDGTQPIKQPEAELSSEKLKWNPYEESQNVPIWGRENVDNIPLISQERKSVPEPIQNYRGDNFAAS